MSNVKITIDGKEFDCVTATKEELTVSTIPPRKCDICGEICTGIQYQVFDENWRVQPDLVSCGCNMHGTEQHP